MDRDMMYNDLIKKLDKAVEFAKVKRMELHGQFANHGQHLAEAA
jgi:hypothetical protein